MSKLEENKERVLQFMRGRKSMVTKETVAKYFIWSDSKTAPILNSLVDDGWLELLRQGNKKFYRYID